MKTILIYLKSGVLVHLDGHIPCKTACQYSIDTAIQLSNK